MKEKIVINLKTSDISVSGHIVGFCQDSEELYESLLPQVAEEDWNNIKSLEDYERFWASLLDYIEWVSDEDIDIPFAIKFAEEDYFFSSLIRRLYRQWEKI